MTRKINFEGKSLIKRFESLKLIPYICPAGVLTVGWGHTGKDIIKGRMYSKGECEILLSKDLAYFETGVDSLLKCKLNDNQFSALVSFCFNLGLSTLKKSDFLERLNNGENPNIVCRSEMGKFCFASYTDKEGIRRKKVLEGLVNRRTAEIALFTKITHD